MRGPDAMQESLFTVAKLDDFVPTDHPLRPIRVLVNEALVAMSGRFNEVYADSGRDSIAPEKLIRALLLQVFYSIRSERQLRYTVFRAAPPNQAFERTRRFIGSTWRASERRAAQLRR